MDPHLAKNKGKNAPERSLERLMRTNTLTRVPSRPQL